MHTAPRLPPVGGSLFVNIVTLVDFVVNRDSEPERGFPGCRVVPQVGAPDRRRQERRPTHVRRAQSTKHGKVFTYGSDEERP